MADRTPRFPFSASAEVASDDSVEVTRVTELSRHGCYLETTKHRTAGTRVTVKISSKDQIFEATANNGYSAVLPTDAWYGGRLSRSKATLPVNAEGLVAGIVKATESKAINR
jgi:hypothetical protein